ncbi:MAG: hypothetical protein ABJL67_04275 [Sulfitobacter sp.]
MSFFSKIRNHTSMLMKGHDPKGQRLIGTTFAGEPLWAPKGHSLLIAANGSGKTTSGLMTSLFSLVAGADRPAILVMDGKNGEIAAQCVPMLTSYGVPVAVIDDMNVRPELPARTSLNPLGALLDADDSASVFAVEKINPRPCRYRKSNVPQSMGCTRSASAGGATQCQIESCGNGKAN